MQTFSFCWNNMTGATPLLYYPILFHSSDFYPNLPSKQVQIWAKQQNWFTMKLSGIMRNIQDAAKMAPKSDMVKIMAGIRCVGVGSKPKRCLPSETQGLQKSCYRYYRTTKGPWVSLGSFFHQAWTSVQKALILVNSRQSCCLYSADHSLFHIRKYFSSFNK